MISPGWNHFRSISFLFFCFIWLPIRQLIRNTLADPLHKSLLSIKLLPSIILGLIFPRLWTPRVAGVAFGDLLPLLLIQRWFDSFWQAHHLVMRTSSHLRLKVACFII